MLGIKGCGLSYRCGVAQLLAHLRAVFCVLVKPIQLPIGSSEHHHLYTSTGYSFLVKPCKDVMQTKLLKVVFLHLMER